MRPYSYRDDAAVPHFPDDKPIIIFDGYCALCSGWATFVLRHDPEGKFRLLSAQSPLGHALYVHYGLDPQDYETNILISETLTWFRKARSVRPRGANSPCDSCRESLHHRRQVSFS